MLQNIYAQLMPYTSTSLVVVIGIHYIPTLINGIHYIRIKLSTETKHRLYMKINKGHCISIVPFLPG
jgi:hypothetical protein